MLVKPYGADNWWQVPQRMHPDRLEEFWERCWGEFSVYAHIAFEKHLEKLWKEKRYGQA